MTKAIGPRARKVRVLATLGPASSDPEMIATLFQAGADAYLNKPIDFGALAALMGRVGGGRDAVAQMALPSSETSVAA